MIAPEDAPYTYEYDDYYKILPAIHNWSLDPLRINDGKLVDPEFTYSSSNNTQWMPVNELREWITKNKDHIGIL